MGKLGGGAPQQGQQAGPGVNGANGGIGGGGGGVGETYVGSPLVLKVKQTNTDRDVEMRAWDR
jgi:hypothetical protein